MTTSTRAGALPDGLLDALASAVGAAGVVLDRAAIEPALSDWRGLVHGDAPLLLRPGSTGDLSAAMKLLYEAGVPVVPQGGNTSSVAGASPDESGRQVVLSLSRMNRIRDIDPVDMTVTAEAGVVLQTLHDALDEHRTVFPLTLSSQGSATIGGILSTNAGGNNTLRYGNARDLMLGLEVVLPDGRVVDALRRLRKDNTGYALRHLFAGAEGTLGVIAAAVLKIVAAPRSDVTAFCSVESEDAALALFRLFRDRDEAAVRAFEYMSGAGIDMTLRHVDRAVLPVRERPAHAVIVELASTRPGDDLRALAEEILAEAFEAGVVSDAAIADSEARKAAIWRLREELPEAQKRAGACVRNDVSAPVSKTPALIRMAGERLEKLVPGARYAPFGHIGDGNIHVNVVQPDAMSAEAFLARSKDIAACVNEIVRELDGSFSAEHGVGGIKTELMPIWRGGAELETMLAIKAALDPKGLMNPGKIFR